MDFEFYKYQGTGNDFVMIDGRDKKLSFSNSQISAICDRRFGIGADGLIILQNAEGVDFEMDYYNADGSKSFCGNGSRCAQAFAKQLGIIKDRSRFLAIDGIHEGLIEGESYATKMGSVALKAIQTIGADWFVHTGSPHYLRFVKDVDAIDVFKEGREVRYSDAYREEGVNVNFIEIKKDILKVRTYERGVEGETFSCGTGVTAAAIAYASKENIQPSEVKILSKGGELNIRLKQNSEGDYTDIWLVGPAKLVYSGEYTLS